MVLNKTSPGYDVKESLSGAKPSTFMYIQHLILRKTILCFYDYCSCIKNQIVTKLSASYFKYF